MIIKKLIKCLILLIYINSAITFGQSSGDEQGNFRMGVSQVNITPELPVLMSGYSQRETPFTGVNDDLYASALFFSDGKTKSLLITADLIGFNFEFIDELKQLISSEIQIPSDNIIISAVHNHGGPSLRTQGNKAYKKDSEKYVKTLKKKLVSMSVEASKELVPFRMGIGKSFCTMNMNRRAELYDGSIGLGKNPDGPCDHDLGVVKFEDMNSNILAVLINWPCHATVGGKDNYQITGDWPGAAARYIKEHAGNDIIVGITAGASADINPVYGPGIHFKHIEIVGYHVAKEAWKAISNTPVYPVNSMQVSNALMTFPGKKVSTSYFPQTTFESGPDIEIRLSVLKIGNLVLAGVSGELMTEIGMQIKDQSPYSNTFIVTHCNGSSGYICTDKAYTEGGYEIVVSRLMPGVEVPLVKKFLELIYSF